MQLSIKIKILQVGKVKNKGFSLCAQDYVQKIKRLCKLEIISVKNSQQKNKTLIQAEEGKLLLNKIDPRDYPILLDETGKLFSSKDFSQFLQGIWEKKMKNPCFLLGGPYGHSDNLKQNVNSILSLSPLTFAHELAYVVLLEQIYRGLTLILNHPYHNP